MCRLRGKRLLVEGLLVIAIVAGVSAILYREMRKEIVTPPNRWSRSMLKQLQIGLMQYYSEHGELPSAGGNGPANSRSGSWRVALLPYLERQDLYDRLSAAPSVSSLQTMAAPAEFQIPGMANGPFTNYVALTGPGTAWDILSERCTRERMEELADKALVLEIPDNQVVWTSRKDIGSGDLLQAMRDPNESWVKPIYVQNGQAWLQYVTVDGAVKSLPFPLSKADVDKMLVVETDVGAK